MVANSVADNLFSRREWYTFRIIDEDDRISMVNFELR